MQQIATQQHWIDTPQGQLFAQSWSPQEVSGDPIVLLHDSLGCVELWRDFPIRLAKSCGRRVIAYDRLGFGRSAAYSHKLPASFIEDEAHGGFRALYQQLDLSQFVLMGHSVGGGIAVSCAAAYPQACLGLITESAQAFVEVETLAGIRAAERQFAIPGQLDRLQRYHAEKAEWVLRAWIDTWLSDDFIEWSLDGQLTKVRCPLLVLHGDRDEYGSRHQPERISTLAARPGDLHILADCGHVPHREYPEKVLAAINAFLAQCQAPSTTLRLL